MDTIRTKSAGGVVVNVDGDVLVVNQRGNSWSLPKGHVDPGEDEIDTAKREIREESGIQSLVYVAKLGTYRRYRIGIDGASEDTSEEKEITLFVFTTKQLSLKPEDPHNPEARWVSARKALKLLTHPKDREFFSEQLPTLYKHGVRQH